MFPFKIPIYIPRSLSNAILDSLGTLRIIPKRPRSSQRGYDRADYNDDQNGKVKPYVRLRFPLDFVTAPLIADLFLLAILAIGRQEVHDGTVGRNSIYPIDIMAFFLTLAYIAISIDASGLIRYLAFKVLEKGGENGNRLFLYLYTFFFGLATCIGNDPIVLSGTAFLAYMTRVSSNIKHPRAWIFTQFTVANIGSAILVSSNPTNLVLAGAFDIKFIDYTANMIVPVIVTAIILFPFLLWIIFPYESLIPSKIELHQLSQEKREKKPVNPNIPYARGTAEEEEKKAANGEEGKLLSLEEIMNPFVDKGGAGFGAIIMAATLITILVINAADQKQHPVFWVTLPAAFVMFCWDVGFGWYHRHETREIAQKGRREIELARAKEALQAVEEAGQPPQDPESREASSDDVPDLSVETSDPEITAAPRSHEELQDGLPSLDMRDEKRTDNCTTPNSSPNGLLSTSSSREIDEKGPVSAEQDSDPLQQRPKRATLMSLIADAYRWSQETFPTVTAVLSHLPYKLVPFALCMFVLVQALVTKGWVQVFAYGWDHWVRKTGTIGAIGGMGFLSVIMCNVSTSSSRQQMTQPANLSQRYVVRRYEHRHYHSSVSRNTGVGKDPPRTQHPYLFTNFLGNGVQHGPGCQLRCI